MLPLRRVFAGFALLTACGARSPVPRPATLTRIVATTATATPRFDYPETKHEDVTDVLHGMTVHDPYRWLEGEGADVTAWMEAQDARARRRISELADVDARWDEMLRLWKPIAAPIETTRGARSFFRGSGQLVMRERGRPWAKSTRSSSA